MTDRPSAATMQAARTAGHAVRVSYQQTEVFRFGNAIVDDWEGRVNACPLDEGLIDYVADPYGGPTAENQLAALNVIANPVSTLSGREIDATDITPALLKETLHAADGAEANVGSTPRALPQMIAPNDPIGRDPEAYAEM